MPNWTFRIKKTTAMKFYDCKTAPSPRRVRIFIAEKGLQIETVEVDLRSGEHLGDEFRAMNPDCTVPILELESGQTITEVTPICRYLEEMFPETPLLGRDAAERAQVSDWIAKVEQQGLGAIAELFRNRAKGFAGRAVTGPVSIEQIPELAERGMQRTGVFFDRLNKHFASNQYLAGDYYSFADISAFVAVDFAAWSKIEIGEEREALQRWYDLVRARPAIC